jgi:serine/threonine protein kinase
MSSESESESSDENIEQKENLNLQGKILRKYNIILEIGRGACSIVWLVYNVNDNKYYALKVQDPTEYNSGLSEIEFMQKLPKKPAVFNNILDYFVHTENKKNIFVLYGIYIVQILII